MIWPMSQIVYALTSTSDDGDPPTSIQTLKQASTRTGFMHESPTSRTIPPSYTRPWFAWANTLFGELIGKLAHTKPALLRPA